LAKRCTRRFKPTAAGRRERKTLAETLSGGLQLVSGGTDNHLLLVDVTPLGMGESGRACARRCGITVNMNMIPFDERKPMDPSGIRIGTPALTTRGMGEAEMRQIGRHRTRGDGRHG
jgi:glycine hydroxymethyltransferase